MIFKTNLARENWRTKYRYNEEDPLGTFQRVARALALVEKKYYKADALEYLEHSSWDEHFDYWYNKFLNTLVKFEDDTPVGLKCTTGGRITANAGTEYQKATAFNCFINSPVTNATISYTKKVPHIDQIIHCEMKSEQTPDNLTNIFLSILECAETLKSEGGYGINFGFIRPRGTLIKGVGIRHPGVVSYMDIWDKVSEVIVKGDEDGYIAPLENHLDLDIRKKVKGAIEKEMARKGAMMAVLPVWHPDIEEFATAKLQEGRLSKFNISVLADDAFMQAVTNDEMYSLHFDGKVYKRVRAVELYELLMSSTHTRNDPGILFLDNINRQNPLIYLGPATATNPCGEIGGLSFLDKGYKIFAQEYLQPYLSDDGEDMIGSTTVCLLGSVNLTQYVNKDRTFDFETYKEDVKTFARMLENVNDDTFLPLPAYQWAVDNVRQYGMGLNGLGSAMLMMGLRYGSEESLEFVKTVSQIKDNETLRASALLAKERGAFPAYTEAYLETPYFRDYCTASEEVKDLVRKYGVRNAKRLTNPPLGNSSVICDNVSNGIEPAFSFEYDRTVMTDKWPEGLNLDNVKDILKETTKGGEKVWEGEYAGKHWLYEPSNRGLCFIEPVRDYGYNWMLENFPEDIEKGVDYLVTAYDITIDEHVAVQAMRQRHVDQAVSKTANLPADYPFEDFKDLYIMAWRSGLAGFTTYREGTMGSVLSVNETYLTALKKAKCITDDAQITEAGTIVKNVKLPDIFKNGETHIVKREGNKYYINFSYLPNFDKHPVALFVHSNNIQAGEYVSLNRGCRAIQKLLIDQGVDTDLVLDQVEKVRDNPHHTKLGKMISMALRHGIQLQAIVDVLTGVEGDYISSTLTAIRKFLSSRITDGTKVNKACANCGSDNVVYEGGCETCRDCGGSACG